MCQVPDNQRCETCRFCEVLADESGVCRRYAPHPRVAPRDNILERIVVDWPDVSVEDDWCGEWQAKGPGEIRT